MTETETETLPYLDEVRAGIALLDERGPAGWRYSVHLGRLNMFSLTACVLGQVYGDWAEGMSSLGISTTPDAEYRYGFDARPGTADYDALTDTWRTVLRS